MKRLLNFTLVFFLLAGSVADATLSTASAQTSKLNGAESETEIIELAARLVAVEKAVEEKRAELGVPGAALVIVKDDRVILAKGFGLRDVERRLPVTADTLFDTQSVTKPFTALAAMMSVDDGKLSLEDSPKKFLPFLKFRDAEIDAKVTIRDMLSHQTGLAGANLPWQTRALSRAEMIQVIASAKPTAKPRERFQYNNPMYSVVGEVVAKAQKSTYERVIAERILKPLKMTASSLSVYKLQKSSDFAFGYEFTDKPGEVRKYPFYDYSNITAAGGLNSNAKDMGQFLRLMPGEGLIDGKRLVSEKSFKEMFSPQIKLGATGYWALGWSSAGSRNGHRIIFHSGATEGFNAIIVLMPDKKLGFALLTNISVSPLARGAVDEVIWTNLVGEREPEVSASGGNASAPTPQLSPQFVAPTTVEELMTKMIDAAGGEANLRKHKSSVTTAAVEYEQQGVTGKATIHGRAPGAWSQTITLSALGKKLGTTHEFFDGATGGAERSYLHPWTVPANQLSNWKIASDFYPLLNWKRVFKAVTIRELSKVGDEDTYVVVKTPEIGASVTEYVSTKSFLVLRRETPNGIVESFGDYRVVDGVMIPFRTETRIPGIGNIVYSVKHIRFNAAVPDSVFRAKEKS